MNANNAMMMSMGVVMVFSAVVQADLYDAGYVWNRSRDDIPGVSSSTYTYEYLSKTGVLGSADPWWDNDGTMMGWYYSSSFGGSYWSRGVNLGPLVAKDDVQWTTVASDLTGSYVPAYTWVNPAAGERVVSITGRLTFGTYTFVGNVQAAIAKWSSESGWVLLGSIERSNGGTWDVDIQNVPVKQGDWIRETFTPIDNGSGPNQWAWITDKDLDITVQSAPAPGMMGLLGLGGLLLRLRKHSCH